MLSQQPDVISMLPLSELARTEEKKEPVRNLILYEPSAEEVFDAIVPEYLAGLIYGGVCEAQASELAARRMAMEAATGNAEEMIENLNLFYDNDIYGLCIEPYYEAAANATMQLDRLLLGEEAEQTMRVNRPIVYGDTMEKYLAIYEEVKDLFGLQPTATPESQA